MVYAIFSSVSIWMVGPLFNLIFYPQENIEQVAPATITETLVADDISIATDLKTKMRQYVDSFIVHETVIGTLLRLCVAILGIFFIKNLAYYVNLYMMSLIEQSVVRDIRNELYESIANLSLDYFNKARVGTLISRVTNDVGIINTALAATFINLIKDPLLLVFYLFIVFVISWKLTIIALLVSLTTVFIINRIGKILRKQALISQIKMASIVSVIQETISAMRVVKAFAAGDKSPDSGFVEVIQ